MELHDWGLAKGPDQSAGIEAANKFLRAKLQLVQKDLDKIAAEKSQKDARIAALMDTLKSTEEEKKRLAKNVGNLETQIEKLKKSNESLRKQQVDSEAEIQSLRKVSFESHTS